jgi:hypothetical protein
LDFAGVGFGQGIVEALHVGSGGGVVDLPEGGDDGFCAALEEGVTVYRAFEGLFEALHRFQVVSYTSEIEQIYQSMSWEQKRVGTQDCRIVATAIALVSHQLMLMPQEGAIAIKPLRQSRVD